MYNSKYKWNVLEQNLPSEEKGLINVLLKNRKINDLESKKRFFSNENYFNDPFLFNDMNKCVMRINEAISNNEKIMLYGDYDVDGVTGTAILYKTLKKLNANVSYYIPSRFDEGYGPNLEAFKKFVNNGFTLLITIDNGITGINEAQYLSLNDVDLIITDHHESKEEIPKAYCIIHPKIDGENYPFRNLAGCGVAFKVAHALLGYLPKELSDLAALGTYADIVSAVDENRAILKMGMKELANTTNIGLKSLTTRAKVKKIDEFALGFIYGPRLNAPGRMLSGNKAVKLLVSEDYQEANRLANDIELLNEERKTLIDKILDEAIAIIEKNSYYNKNVLIVENDSWHEGVLGIVANRLLDIYNKPVIVLTENEGLYKGSARTLSDFPLFENLNKCSEVLEKFGGHKMAAGLSIKKENINILREKLHQLAGNDIYNILNIDCKIDEKLMNVKTINEFEKFRPFGVDNQKPLFLFSDFIIDSITMVGVKNKHLKLVFKKNNNFISSIAFNMGNYYHYFNKGDIIDIVGNLEINEYNNKITVQLVIKDLRCKHLQVYDYRSKRFNKDLYNNMDIQYIYFNNQFEYTKAYNYKSIENLKENIFLIDLPNSIEELKSLINQSNVKNIFTMFKCEDIFSYEHLITREKMINIYKVFKKHHKFKRNNRQVINDLERIGINKKIQIMALKVFFELNFAIIDNDEVIIVENPPKRNLTESETYQNIINVVDLKEKLLFSTYHELREILMNI